MPPSGSCESTLPSSVWSSTISSTTCASKPDDFSWARASAAVWLVTSGTCEVAGPCETWSVTTEPLPSCVPAAGFWPTTIPASAASSTSSRATANPTPWSCDWAVSKALPTTFGIVTGRGPFETLIRTVAFSISSVPGLGAWASTSFTGLSEFTATTLAFSLAPTISATASSRLLPTTFGTCVFGFPSDTVMVTKFPRSIFSPGCGSCLKTLPCFASLSGARMISSSSPASLICLTASRSGKPFTSGTATGFAWLS